MSRRTPTGPPEQHPYRRVTMAVGTRHGKAAQLAPAFREHLGARLVTPADLDTDQFGTFSGECPRRGIALDAARHKARLAADASGLSYALASEASYGLLPQVGVAGHEELLVFLDIASDIEVVEGYRTTDIPGTGHVVAAAVDVPERLLAGLRAQALIVRPTKVTTAGDITKGISARWELPAAISRAVHASPDGLAVVEPDLRAHHNPSRRIVLARLGRQLASRLARLCPACSTPGFGRIDIEAGLPCRLCETPTSLPRRHIHGCARCPHQTAVDLPTLWADPRHCPECNP